MDLLHQKSERVATLIARLEEALAELDSLDLHHAAARLDEALTVLRAEKPLPDS